jgi:hypothetical protein
VLELTCRGYCVGSGMIDPLFSLSGFVVGMLVGMTGVVGGSLMTPLLILLFGVHAPTAVGTDLFYAAATKTTGSFVHGLSRSIDWRVVGRLATGSVPATATTVLVLSDFDLNSAGAQSAITLVLCGALSPRQSPGHSSGSCARHGHGRPNCHHGVQPFGPSWLVRRWAC